MAVGRGVGVGCGVALGVAVAVGDGVDVAVGSGDGFGVSGGPAVAVVDGTWIALVGVVPVVINALGDGSSADADSPVGDLVSPQPANRPTAVSTSRMYRMR